MGQFKRVEPALLTIQVVNRSGIPIEGIEVQMGNENNHWYSPSYTDADGYVAFEVIPGSKGFLDIAGYYRHTVSFDLSIEDPEATVYTIRVSDEELATLNTH